MKRSFFRINVGVDRSVATRGAQVVWPLMIGPATNLRASGSNSEIFAKMMCIFGENGYNLVL